MGMVVQCYGSEGPEWIDQPECTCAGSGAVSDYALVGVSDACFVFALRHLSPVTYS
jgi:hypothetical protein